MIVSCLHSVSSAIPAFEAACPKGIRLAHHIRSDLRYQARTGITPRVRIETTAHLRKLSAGSDAVLVTCEVLSAATEPPALTADALLAEEVDRRGKDKPVEVLYLWPGSQAHLTELFSGLERPASVSLTCVDGAWDCIDRLDFDRLECLVRKAVTRSEARLIALTNPLMLPPVADDPRVLGISDAAIGRLQKRPMTGRQTRRNIADD